MGAILDGVPALLPDPHMTSVANNRQEKKNLVVVATTVAVCAAIRRQDEGILPEARSRLNDCSVYAFRNSTDGAHDPLHGQHSTAAIAQTPRYPFQSTRASFNRAGTPQSPGSIFAPSSASAHNFASNNQFQFTIQDDQNDLGNASWPRRVSLPYQLSGRSGRVDVNPSVSASRGSNCYQTNKLLVPRNVVSGVYHSVHRASKSPSLRVAATSSSGYAALVGMRTKSELAISAGSCR